MSTLIETEASRPTRHRRRLVDAVIGTATVMVLGVAGWLVHGYFYDASFMQIAPGYSAVEINTCTTGETFYFGYSFVPTREVHFTGAELVGVSDAFTVEGIYAINQAQSAKALFGGGTEQSWVRYGYSKDRLYPVSAVDLNTRGSNWWLVAKIIPRKTGQHTIQGIKVYYTAGLRSGSAVLNEKVITDCAK